MSRQSTRVYGTTLLVLALSAGTLLTLSCARQPAPPATGDLPGFFTGLLHGFLMFFSLIGSIFTDVRVDAASNSGGWYDFGYVLGASMFWGGGGAGARSSRGRGYRGA